MLAGTEMIVIVTLLVCGLLGVLGLLVVYVARIVKNLEEMTGKLNTLAEQQRPQPQPS